MPGGMLSDAPGSGITCLHSSCSLLYLPVASATVSSSIHLPPLPTLFLSYVSLLRWLMGLFISLFTLFDVLCVSNSSTVPSLKSEINCSSFLFCFVFYRNNELPKKVYRNGVLLVYSCQPMCCSYFWVVGVVVVHCCCCCCCLRVHA